MNFKIPYIDGRQKESDRIKGNPFTYLGKEQNNDFEQIYIKSEDTDGFNQIKLKKDILALKKNLKRYGISFRDLLFCAPKHEDSRLMCIKIARRITEDERLWGKIEKTKTLPVQEVLNVISIYRGTLEKNRKFVIALCLIITSGLKSLNAYMDQTDTQREQNRNIGTIIELAQDGAIVISNDCNFVLIRKRKKMFLGQQVKFADWDIKENNRNTVRRAAVVAGIASFAAILSLAVFHSVQISPIDRTYALVDIDINPSLKLLLDRGNSVVEINTINKDADTLLMDNDLRGMSADDAIEMVFELAHDRGFVYEDKENLVLVSLALNPDTDKKGDEEEKFEQLLTQIKLGARGDEVIIPVVIEVPQETVKSAYANNLSIGRQYIYEKSKEQSGKFDLGEVRKSSIGDLLSEVGFVRERQ